MTSRSHEKWTPEEEADLFRRFCDGAFPAEIAHDLGRSELAIRTRLAKHDLLPPITAEELAYFSSLRAKPSEPPKSDVEAADSATRRRRRQRRKSPSADIVVTYATSAEAVESVPVDIQQAFHRFHFVYAIVNSHSQVYVGYSQDVWHRVSQHNRNVGARATRNTGPWFPFSIFCLAAEVDARSLELNIHRNFDVFSRHSETSIREVLAQIGVPFEIDKLSLVL